MIIPLLNEIMEYGKDMTLTQKIWRNKIHVFV